MKNLLRLSVCLTALSLYSLQASSLEEERNAQAQQVPTLSQLLEHHLDKPLSLTDITTIRRTLAEHILSMTGAQTVAQEGWAQLYLDSLADPTQAYYVSQETVRKILDLDDNGRFRLQAPVEGSGSVPTHRTAHFGGVYFKQDGRASLMPGMEYAMYSFYGMLVGQVLAPSCLMVLRNVVSPHDNSFFVQASQLIPGLTLEKSLQNGQIPVLNPDNLSRFLTGSWLSNPSDYKPDNMIVSSGNGQNYLLGIDDDLALNDPVVRENKDIFQHVLGIKQILYCIPEYMDKTTFSEQLRRELLAINPSLKVLEWLHALTAQNKKYDQLRQARILYEGDQAVLGLPIRLIPGIAGHIEQQLSYLQAILHDHPSLTHGQVWQKLQPVPHFIYKSITQQNRAPLDCLNLIYARGEQPLETYLPLNTYLEGYVQTRDGQRIYTRRRLYQHLRQYQALAGDHVNNLTEDIQAAVAMLLNHVPIAQLSYAERNIMYQFAENHFPEILLASANPGWQQVKSFQELNSNKNLTVAQKSGLSLRLGLADSSQTTELHRWVKGGNSYHDHIRALIQQRRVDIDTVNGEGFTALDEALTLKDTATVKVLLELGAGKQVKLVKLMNFYQQHADEEEWQSLFRDLRTRNREFAWQSSLWHLFPPVPNQAVPAERVVRFASLRPTQRSLPDEVWQQVMAQGNQIRRANQEGRRAVAKAVWERNGEIQSVYLKFFPELPGFEAAISLLLNRYLFGFGAPYGELALLGDLPCYITQGIKGDSLLTVLKNNPGRLKQLDAYSLSALYTGMMITAPEDGNPSNYIVEGISPRVDRLVGIDLDHALADPIAQEVVQNRVKCSPQVKTILYCMDQMQDPIHPEVKAKILATDFKTLLERWLTMLSGMQQEYNALFNNDTEQLQKLYLNEKNPCFIGIPFKTEMIAKLYDRCIRMQTFLNQQDDKLPSHYAILRAVDPILAERYTIKPIQYLSLLERFEKLDGKYFQKSQHGHYITTSNLDILLAGLHLDVQKQPEKKRLIEAVRKSENIGPAQALRELQAEHQVLASKDRSLQQFKALKTEGARAAFLEQLTSVVASLQDIWLQEIQNQPCRHLTLSSFNQLTDNNLLKLITNMKNLTYLSISGCKSLKRDSLIRKLASNSPTLTFLDASQTAFEKFIWHSRRSGRIDTVSFPRLKVLKLEKCQRLTTIKLNAPKLLQLSLANSSNLISIEGRLPNLNQLNLSRVNRLPQTVFDQMFGQLAQFKVINLKDCPQLQYADLITEFPGYSLQVYKFVSQLPEDQREPWQRLLRNDKDLQQLDLKNMRIGDAGARALGGALKMNSSLQQLILENNEMSIESARALGEMLKVNSSLRHLSLNSNKIGVEGTGFLGEMLKLNSSLKRLDLEHTEISTEGARALSEALKVNSSLQHLSLNGNKIGDAGTRMLGEALKLNNSLKRLDMEYNGIDTEGARALSEALKVNSSLQHLSLNGNKIGDAGTRMLGEALKLNNSLKRFNMEYNEIGTEGARALSEALKVNSSLQQLDLKRNKIDNTQQKQIDELLKGRAKLSSVTQDSLPETAPTPAAITEEWDETLLAQLLQPPAAIDTLTESPASIRVNPEPWSYSILSIDGGGIRGLIPALILERMKEEWLGHTDIHSLFDYIGGTSVGGILSLGLTVPQAEDDRRPRYSISDLTQLFSAEGHRIFPQDMKIVKKIKQTLYVKYSEKPLEGLLQEYFGDTLLSSALTPTLVTTWVNYGQSRRPEGFAFTSVAAQKNELDDYRIWEVARCTSAAPTYFKGYQIKNIHNRINFFPSNPAQPLIPYRLYSLNNNQTYLQDGGVWYNNPAKLTYRALQACMAQNAVPVTEANCIVVSLGTGQAPTVSGNPSAGALGAISSIIEGSFYQKDQEIENYCRRFGENYYRFQPILQREITLDDSSPANLNALREAAATLYPGDKLETLARKLLENKANRPAGQL